MLQGLIEARMGRLLAGALMLGVGGATAFVLSGGRDALKVVGLSHFAAGAIATALTVVVALVGLAYFAVYVIDWE